MLEPQILKLSPPSDVVATILLAHGAGAPMDSEFLNLFANELVARRCEVLRFEFPYMRQRRDQHIKRPPDKMPVLLESWQAHVNFIRESLPTDRKLLIGGKSLGGRVASMIADAAGVDGLICLGYPFHPVKKPDRLRTEHLSTLETPTLILQGTRDALGSQDEVPSYQLAHSINLKWLPDGDHDFKPRKKSGYTHSQHLKAAADHVFEFICQL